MLGRSFAPTKETPLNGVGKEQEKVLLGMQVAALHAEQLLTPCTKSSPPENLKPERA